TAPFEEELRAPLRMDLALTYRCQNNCLHCYAKGPHETQELTTEQWRLVLKKLFEAQIPAVSFTGGEPTLRDDLVELVAATQSIGLVSGLITNGRRLSDKAYAEKLYRAGLDFAQITLESNRPEVHEKMTRAPGSWKETVDGVRNCLNLGLYVVTNTTISPYNVDHALELVRFLKKLGVVNFAMNSLIYSGRGEVAEKDFLLPRDRLRKTLDEVKHEAFLLGMEFNWYSPTRYCELNPVTMGLGAKFCSACRTNMAVEPDGTVLPCQSWFKSVGNILTDPWEKIWSHELCVYIRRRGWLELEERCCECEWRKICGAACPLEAEKKRIPHTECSVT
ncbi:MAG: radical SAM protein, partial [Candidatus Bathyarchaeia archaeon]